MSFRCPTCRAILSDAYICTNGHQFFVQNGVLKLTDEKFGQELDSWLSCYEDFRTPEFKEDDFSLLPQSGLKINKAIWKARCSDLQIVDRLIHRDYKAALDIGSWVGWLAHQLSKRGLDVMAIDYFTHHLDGLEARKHYKNATWMSIQMNLEELDILEVKFDLIVINRCYSYFTEPEKGVVNAKKMLNRGGKLVITGLNIRTKGSGVAKELIEARIRFRDEYDKSLDFKSFKGYSDISDLEVLRKMGFKIYPYPDFKNRIKRSLFPTKIVSYYAVFIKNGN